MSSSDQTTESDSVQTGPPETNNLSSAVPPVEWNKMKEEFFRRKEMPEEFKQEALEAATEECSKNFVDFPENYPDFNMDGPITVEDWIKGRGVEKTEEHWRRKFDKHDKNKDGIITKKELI